MVLADAVRKTQPEGRLEMVRARVAKPAAGGPARDLNAYQFVAVEGSISPTDASQRSASMAALQPSPAAVTAWR